MLNPIVYTENVVSDFLRYQLTAYPFADTNLYEQMRSLLNLEKTRSTPLLQGPYISLSRIFQQGVPVHTLVDEGIFHPHMKTLVPHSAVYRHQENAIRSIVSGKSTLVSTGTGSGKTECFLYPIISHCLTLRDHGAPEGIVAVIVYPMNALAEDQLGRLRDLLAGTGISFGMYVGKTVEKSADIAGQQLKSGASEKDYRAALEKNQQEKRSQTVHPAEERVSREAMRQHPPRILLTNVNQLELLLTRQRDIELFQGVDLKFLVFDEAHTFSGATGAETACLIRRLRAFCGKGTDETACIATSATIADPDKGKEAGREFASRFFGVPIDQVTLVGEEYQDDNWNPVRRLSKPFKGDLATHLQYVLRAVEDETGGAIRTIYAQLTGYTLNAQNWQSDLYNQLAANELVFQINQFLRSPLYLGTLLYQLKQQINRAIREEEVLIWLALGAASRQEGRPLLRPVVHGFVRGVSGAVVTFPSEQTHPKLWLAAEDAVGDNGDGLYRLPITTCTTCGQHYFVHHIADFNFLGKLPGGGQAVDNHVIWKPLAPDRGGDRLVLIDRLITDSEDDNESDMDGGSPTQPRGTAPLYFCRHCGTLHSTEVSHCSGCGHPHSLVQLFAIGQDNKAAGYLTRCLACGAFGRSQAGGYREPARAVRAVAVSDVHVLAQNMIHHAERRRLLVFADNRQDAAFQAGWMQDHARRFRLRSLMYERIRQGSVSIGDLTAYLDDWLNADDELSRSLVPEVWRVHRKEAEGVKHNDERKRFLRIQVLREVTTGTRQRIGLEPWGRLEIQYAGLSADHPFFSHWGAIAGVSATELVNGIASLLDVARRNSILLDREGHIFSRFWHPSDFEIMRGYMPINPSVPKGLKLRYDAGDNKQRILTWIVERGSNVARQSALRWGIPNESVNEFFEALWELLTSELKLLAPSVLKGKRNALPRCSGVYQIDADQLRLAPHHGIYRCDTCRRVHIRPTPKMACMAWRCSGTLKAEAEDPDNYDLMVLDQQFAMLRSREHSAQVPATERESLERMFKGDNEMVNTLVCTPTLEMGVNIGSLDSVLMRNVPPLPANYWQRAGRAGRQHRMAVNLTYARQASHDRAYFADPLKLLNGTVTPPRFNLRNTLMIRKHVHASVLTVLNQLARSGTVLSLVERQTIRDVLDTCFPKQIKTYLFSSEGYVRPHPLNVSALNQVLQTHRLTLLDQLQTIFSQGWPVADQEVVTQEVLESFLQAMTTQLEAVIHRLWKRLQWALDQKQRLSAQGLQKGTLDPDERALYERCDRLIAKLKGTKYRNRSEAEGYDDTNTFSVLASEGFLPGYGLDIGSIRGTAQMPRALSGWLSDFELPRPPAVALREYVPGNLIYANSNRFIPRFFHLEPEQQPTLFQVDVANEAIVEVGIDTTGIGSSLGAAGLSALPICDVDLPHQSHISDDEDYRFQLATFILGQERDRHSGGKGYQWAEKSLLLLRGVHFRLVNVGVTSLIRAGNSYGYPVCRVCGQSRSPFASQADLDAFRRDHRERCGAPEENVGFFADVTADALCIQECGDREEAYSVLEALRLGASTVLDMELDDIQVLVVGYPGVEKVDGWLYDPMPGGSGLLDQMIHHWADVASAALDAVGNCASACETACIDCLFTFRNAYYHRYLNRHRAAERLTRWNDRLNFSHDIPQKLPQSAPENVGKPVNNAESRLQSMLKRAGFPDAFPQHAIDLGRPLGTTTPDFFFEDPTERSDGICIYLDGMSRHIHGNPDTQQRDRTIRDELSNQGYEVITIPAGNLDDQDAMKTYFYRLGRLLLGKAKAIEIRDQLDWFETTDADVASEELDEDQEEFLDLFNPEWQLLIRQLLAHPDLRIEPGADVSHDGSVVGTYIAELTRRDFSVYLVEKDASQYARLYEALQTPNKIVQGINPEDEDAIAQILNALQ